MRNTDTGREMCWDRRWQKLQRKQYSKKEKAIQLHKICGEKKSAHRRSRETKAK